MSTTIVTMTKMLETLPEAMQNRVVEHLREYIADLQDDIDWDVQFERTQKQLIAAAKKAKQEIAAGLAETMDYDRL